MKTELSKWFPYHAKFDGFDEFIEHLYEEDLFDEQCGGESRARAEDLIDKGRQLAMEANGRPIQQCYVDNYTFYFIGTEEEVLKRLDGIWETWVIKRCTMPQAGSVSAARKDAELAVETAKKKLKAIKSLEKKAKK